MGYMLNSLQLGYNVPKKDPYDLPISLKEALNNGIIVGAPYLQTAFQGAKKKPQCQLLVLTVEEFVFFKPTKSLFADP